MAILRVFDPSGASTDHVLHPDGVTISGRELSPSPTVVRLPNPENKISRRHATIRRAGNQWILEDHSLNGTLVGNREYRKVPADLYHEVTIVFGDVQAIFLDPPVEGEKVIIPPVDRAEILGPILHKIQVLKRFTTDGQFYISRLKEKVTLLERTAGEHDPEHVRRLLAQDHLSDGGIPRDLRAIEDTYNDVLAVIQNIESELLK